MPWKDSSWRRKPGWQRPTAPQKTLGVDYADAVKQGRAPSDMGTAWGFACPPPGVLLKNTIIGTSLGSGFLLDPVYLPSSHPVGTWNVDCSD